MSNLLAFPKPDAVASDSESRATALDIHSSCIVEAPAGSGKTGLLVQRFLKLLADDAVAQPEEILAITFTRKATAEMRERVLEQLQGAQRSSPLDEENEFARATRSLAEAALARIMHLGWNLLAQPQRLNIRSIESVNMDLANSRPLLADSVGPQQPVEDGRPLYRIAARRTLLQLGGGDRSLHSALADLLLHRDGNLIDCERLIATMLETREQWGELVPLGSKALDDQLLDSAVRPKIEQTLAAIVCAGLQRALNTIPAAVLEHLTHFAARHAGLPGYNGNPSPIVGCAGKHQPPTAVSEDLNHWRALIGLVLKSDGEWRKSTAINTFGFKPAKTEIDDFKVFLTSIKNDDLQDALAAVLELPSPAYPDAQWRVAKSLFRVLNHAMVELKLLFAERGECDFTEFSLTARQALHDGSDVSDIAIAAGGKLRHLLVDEMQDTSTGQYELIRLLTQSWDGHSQTLFLVGDPKQSIYLFRQARVERFLRTMQEQRLGEIPLTPLRLTANFRSQAALVRGFNTTFGGTQEGNWIFPPPDKASLRGAETLDVPFVAATSAREQTQKDGLVWHTSVLEQKNNRSPTDRPVGDEAREVCRIIQQRLRMPLPQGRTKPWSIAVLARARGHLSEIVKELKAQQIPFRGVDLDPLNECAEVLDALALTRALLHPADRTAWLAVLHAPWCGLGIADLLALTGEGPDADTDATVAELVAMRRHHLSPTGQKLLDRTWPTLAAAVERLGYTPLSVHVERTWRSLGGDLILPPEREANVLRFLAVLRDLEADRTSGNMLPNLTARLKELFAEPHAGDVQVDLMTIHKAKGLEWDLVIIPGLHRKPRASGSVLLNWLELDAASAEDEASIILAPIQGKGEESDPLNDWLKNIRSRRDRAEEKRLFYVACTRAREELHLFAAAERNTAGKIAQPASGTLLRACWPAAAPLFAELEAMAPPVVVEEEYGLALAAGAEPSPLSVIERLPLSFDPQQRFMEAASRRLNYTPAAALQQRPSFDRPEGSFAVRAFGNVVHRYLQVLAMRLAQGIPVDELLAELTAWKPRLIASLRGEGLVPTLAANEATRALRALTLTLNDPTGRWILAPHQAAASERPLSTAALNLRVDRTFLAGESPLSTGDRCIWIVDFKTTDPGSRSATDFETSERAKYSAQLEAYAAIRRIQTEGHLPIMLGLYYPLATRLLSWRSEGSQSGF